MVEMSRSFALPPVIHRFRRCGSNNDVVSVTGRADTQSATGEGIHRNGNDRHPSSPPSSPFYGGGATAAAGTERVKSFVNGIMSPFVSPFNACWQPSVSSCVSGCAPDMYAKQPAVISPLVDRQMSRRDTRPARLIDQEDYPYSYPNHRPEHVSTKLSSPRKENFVESTGAIAATRLSHSSDTFDKGGKPRITDIEKPLTNDILCGRGGSSNRHLGNIHFRELVAANKKIYVGLTKKQKMLVARNIVDAIHSTNGRFLAKDLDSGLFYDIGLPRSLEKTSQALREKNSNEMPAHLIESEGVETSVESYQSVVDNRESKQDAVESPEGSSASSSPPSSNSSTVNKPKNTGTSPPLVIPSHLISVFSKNNLAAVAVNEEERYHYASSPRTNYNVEQPYTHYHHHLSPSYPQSPPYSTPQPIQYRNSYPQVNYTPSHQFATGTDDHYYYGNCLRQSPPYKRRGHGYDKGYAYPAQEYYNDHHDLKYSDHHQATLRTSRLPKHFGKHQYLGYQHSSTCQHGSIHPSHVLPPKHGSSASIPLQTYSPSQYSHHNHQKYNPDTRSSPSMPHPREDNMPSSSPRIIHRTSSNGYVRGSYDISPERQRELKRQCNVDSHRKYDASLSSAVSKSLSLEERVVGRERGKQRSEHRPEEQQQGGKSTNDGSSSSQVDLVSPSIILQTRSRRERLIINENDRDSPSQNKDDYSSLSGLAALSTAAFLKLDEEKE